MDRGKKIKSAREAKGMSQEALGAACGTTKQTIFKYENGITTNIPFDRIEKIAAVLDISPAYIMGWEDADGKPAPNLRPMPQMQRVPRLGAIACGEPILAAGNIDGYDAVPNYIQCDFTLVCKGDSMINARIFEGDLVCIRQQPEVENGEIAAVLIDGEYDGEATLKRVKLFDDHISLEPENPQYKPLVFWDEDMARVHILGKATHFISPIM